MRLLIVTQAVDPMHPALGFFHRWIEQFATQFEHIHVVGLQVGHTTLPSNVSVYSLGKERSATRSQSIVTFYKTLWSLRGKYDAVFVHMNPEYIVLAGWWWRLMGIATGLWYNHTVTSPWLRLAQPFTRYVFYTSRFAATALYSNAEQMPAGIDTAVFRPTAVTPAPKSIYFQGRLAPAKRIHVILEAFSDLYATGEATLLTLVGPEVRPYIEPLKAKYASLVESGVVVFRGPVPHTETPPLFAAHEVSVNLTDDGNYDKTVLESLACGTPALVSSAAFAGAPVEKVEAPTAAALVDAYRSRKPRQKADLVHYVDATHSLRTLAKRLRSAYSDA